MLCFALVALNYKLDSSYIPYTLMFRLWCQYANSPVAVLIYYYIRTVANHCRASTHASSATAYRIERRRRDVDVTHISAHWLASHNVGQRYILYAPLLSTYVLLRRHCRIELSSEMIPRGLKVTGLYLRLF